MEFANEAIANSSDPKARATYDTARRRLTEEGKRAPLDLVYAALKEAGISDGELDALDTMLDAKIIAAHDRAPHPAGQA